MRFDPRTLLLGKCWSGSPGPLVKSTFRVYGLHRFHLHCYKYEIPVSTVECRHSCVASIGVFPRALMRRPQQKELSSLSIQNLYGPGTIFFVPILVTLVQAHTGDPKRQLLATSFMRSQSPVSAHCCAMLVDDSCTGGQFPHPQTLFMPVILVPGELSTPGASRFWGGGVGFH